MASKVRVTVEIEEQKRDEFLSLLANQSPYANVTTVRKAPRKRKATEETVSDPRPAQTMNDPVVVPQVSRRFTLPSLEEVHERTSEAVVSVFRRAPSPGADDPSEDAQIEMPQPGPPSCQYCLQAPCVVTDGRPRGPPRPTNHAKRLKEYRLYYTQLNAMSLWENPVYLAHKELGCHIDDIREVMPLSVVKDVRSRWPNPPHIPYMGHKRS